MLMVMPCYSLQTDTSNASQLKGIFNSGLEEQGLAGLITGQMCTHANHREAMNSHIISQEKWYRLKF